MGEKGKTDPAAKAASDSAAIAALADIFSKADPDGVARLLSDIVGMAQLKDPSGTWSTVDIDQCFIDGYRKDLFSVALFVLQEVMGDFFGGALASGGLKKLMEKAAG